MLWQLKHGKHAANIEEQCRKTNSKLPDFLANKPVIGAGLQFVWSAFWDLSTCRDVGYGEGPIPWVAINDYCVRHSIYGPEFDRFAHIVRRVDNAYLAERGKKDSKTPINPNQAKPQQKSTLRTR